MQYGDPGTSAIDQPGRVRSYSARSAGSVRAISRPAALRFHTPMRYTQSKPPFAIASHAWPGTFPSVMVRFSRRDSRSSHGQALNS